MTPAVAISGLIKRYGRTTAVADVTLAVAPGETVVLLGPNGSGKTTVLRCVAGLLRPDAGRIEVRGIDVRADERAARRRLSFVPQQAAFPRQATVREIMAFHARLRDVPRARITTALREAGLAAELEARPAGELSVGQRQRLSLAVAQLPEAEVMLLDEPTANLDPEAALEFRALARRWHAEGRALLLATHVLGDAAELADRVIVLVGGRQAGEETAAGLRERVQRQALLRVAVDGPGEAHVAAALCAGATAARLNSHTLIVTAPPECRHGILQQLANLGPIRHFETEEPSLEQVYLEYVQGGARARD